MVDQQKVNEAVARWVDEGNELAAIQLLLREELNHSLTYMETRFLIDDLGLEIKTKASAPAPQPKADAPASADAPVEDDAAGGDDFELIDEEGGGGDVSVSVDTVMRPGAALSGSVTFSDGVSMGWQLDQMGQLGLLPGKDPAYRPSPEDIASFQHKLQEALARQGY